MKTGTTAIVQTKTEASSLKKNQRFIIKWLQADRIKVDNLMIIIYENLLVRFEGSGCSCSCADSELFHKLPDQPTEIDTFFSLFLFGKMQLHQPKRNDFIEFGFFREHLPAYLLLSQASRATVVIFLLQLHSSARTHTLVHMNSNKSYASSSAKLRRVSAFRA